MFDIDCCVGILFLFCDWIKQSTKIWSKKFDKEVNVRKVRQNIEIQPMNWPTKRSTSKNWISFWKTKSSTKSRHVGQKSSRRCFLGEEDRRGRKRDRQNIHLVEQFFEQNLLRVEHIFERFRRPRLSGWWSRRPPFKACSQVMIFIFIWKNLFWGSVPFNDVTNESRKY